MRSNRPARTGLKATGGIKRNLTEDSHTSFCGEVTRSFTRLGNGFKRLKSHKKKGGGKEGPSRPRDKSRELLMQHDPPGPALKIPLGREWQLSLSAK